MKEILDTDGQVITPVNRENAVIIYASYALAELSGARCMETERTIRWGHPFLFEKTERGGRIFSIWSETYKLNESHVKIDVESKKEIEIEMASGLLDKSRRR